MDEFYLLLIKVTLFLFGMMGLLVFVKKYGLRLKNGFQQKDTQREIKRLDSLAIGLRKYLLVLEVRDRIIVLGVSDKEIIPIALWKKENE